MSKLKIGLLVDSVYCSKYIKDLICLIEKSDSLELKTIIVQDIKVENNLFNKIYKSYKKNGIFYIIGKALFLIVIRLEKYTISKNKFFCNHFKSYDLSQYDLNIYILKPIISKSGFVFKFSDDDISIIESLNLDFEMSPLSHLSFFQEKLSQMILKKRISYPQDFSNT